MHAHKHASHRVRINTDPKSCPNLDNYKEFSVGQVGQKAERSPERDGLDVWLCIALLGL